MPVASIHPAHLIKQVFVEYLSGFIPPGSSAVYPSFGAAVGIPVIGDEDQSTKLKPGGGDILVYENGPSEEIAEGAGVWRLSLAIALAVPGDRTAGEFEALEQALWQYLSDEYTGDVSGGGDTPGPLSGRLTATSARLTDADPDKFPRVLCVGDAWQIKRTPPELDSPGLRVMIFTLLAIAEVMPPDFIPLA
jgi:hypothetical protein